MPSDSRTTTNTARKSPLSHCINVLTRPIAGTSFAPSPSAAVATNQPAPKSELTELRCTGLSTAALLHLGNLAVQKGAQAGYEQLQALPPEDLVKFDAAFMAVISSPLYRAKTELQIGKAAETATLDSFGKGVVRALGARYLYNAAVPTIYPIIEKTAKENASPALAPYAAAAATTGAHAACATAALNPFNQTLNHWGKLLSASTRANLATLAKGGGAAFQANLINIGLRNFLRTGYETNASGTDLEKAILGSVLANAAATLVSTPPDTLSTRRQFGCKAPSFSEILRYDGDTLRNKVQFLMRGAVPRTAQAVLGGVGGGLILDSARRAQTALNRV